MTIKKTNCKLFKPNFFKTWQAVQQAGSTMSFCSVFSEIINSMRGKPHVPTFILEIFFSPVTRLSH